MRDNLTQTHDFRYGEFPVCRQAGIWQLKNKL